MLDEAAYAALDGRLAPVDADLRARYSGRPHERAPIHTLYVPADLFGPGVLREYGRLVRRTVTEHGPLPFDADVNDRVLAKLEREPVEDLRIDFEDGYGRRDDDEEDAAATSTATALRDGAQPPFFGLRCKSLQESTRRRAVRTLDLFLGALGPPPPGFVITLPKVSAVAQVEAMVDLCERLEAAHDLAEGTLRFELEIETASAVLGPDGVATVAVLVRASAGRCVGLRYAMGVTVGPSDRDHPTGDYTRAVLQLTATGAGVRLSDGPISVLPVGDTEEVRTAWDLHAYLVRRSLERGYFQGADVHPAQLPTRFGATFAYLRAAAPTMVDQLDRVLTRNKGGSGPEPSRARALAAFLLRGLDCGALDGSDVQFDRSVLEGQI
jgi:citrate lyase beta subunit